MITEAALTKSLNKLPYTAEGIARSLRRRNVFGQVADGETCAVAQYLRREFPHEIVRVDIDVIAVDGARISVSTPMRQFISDFDDLHHPELVAHQLHRCGGPVLEANPCEAYYWVSCDCSAVDYEWDGGFDNARGLGRIARAYYARAKKAYDAQRAAARA